MMKSNNGDLFNFLCKPKDDLRKDARLMDFDSMINKLLQSSPESRRRKLCERMLHRLAGDVCTDWRLRADIRTYAVVTLNEECGLIEWVPNTVGLRHILHKLYLTRSVNLYVSGFRTMCLP
jgi:serine/threonine-protein kinase ATR